MKFHADKINATGILGQASSEHFRPVRLAQPPRVAETDCDVRRLAMMGETADISIEYLGSIRWHLCFCLVLAWLLVLLFVSRGIKSTGKVLWTIK